LVLPEVTNIEDVDRFVAKVLDLFKTPFHIAGSSQYVSASVGLSLYPDDAATAEALLRTADAAMYRAKGHERDVHPFYTKTRGRDTTDPLTMGNSLRKAIDGQEFILHYQPRVNVASRELAGMEVLLRWQHPARGLLAPIHFLPLAEEMGLIVPIGRWVLWNACAQAQAWRLSGLGSNLRIAVNLSGREVSRKELKNTVERALDGTRLPPACLELELTESGIMRDEETATAALSELSAMGVCITIDDFGTGYSALSRLKHFPISALKIDRSFVKDLAKAPCDSAIVTAIITMGHGLQLRVIGEGVEEVEQMEFLREQGCDEMQGYFFGHPQPPCRIASLLANPPEWMNG
jgi:EAL domain-containing protein (putative c-di-GMP-specific phosphodiesterase class I)